MNNATRIFATVCFSASLACATVSQAARLDLWGTGASVEFADCIVNQYGECTGIQGGWQTAYRENRLRARTAGAQTYSGGFNYATVTLGASLDQLQEGTDYLLVAWPDSSANKAVRASAWMLQGFRYTGDRAATLTLDPKLAFLGFQALSGLSEVRGEMYIYDADALEALADASALPDPTRLGLSTLAGTQRQRGGASPYVGKLLSPVSFDVQPGDAFYLWLRASALAGAGDLAAVGASSTPVQGSTSGNLAFSIVGGPIDLFQPATGSAPAPVPLPGAIWLIASGLMGLYTAGRRTGRPE